MASQEKITKEQALDRIEKICNISMGVTMKPATVLNVENIPDESHELVINHRGFMEVGALAEFYRSLGLGWIHFVAKQESFDSKKLGWLFRLIEAIPVDRENPGPSTIRIAVDYLRRKEKVGMFPEGTRGQREDFAKLKPFHEGAVTIAKFAKVPILPVAVIGPEKILPDIEKMKPAAILIEMLRIRLMREKTKIHIAFGEPIVDLHGDRADLTNNLRNTIGGLIEKLEEIN